MNVPPGYDVAGWAPVRPGEGPLGGRLAPIIVGQPMIHLALERATGDTILWLDGPLDAGALEYVGYLFLCDGVPTHFHFAPMMHRHRPVDWVRLGVYCYAQPAIVSGEHGWAWSAQLPPDTEVPATTSKPREVSGWLSRRDEAVRRANDAAADLARTFLEWTPDDDNG